MVAPQDLILQQTQIIDPLIVLLITQMEIGPAIFHQRTQPERYGDLTRF